MNDHKATTMREPTTPADASPCDASGAPLATYYVLSLVHSKGDSLLWWRPKDAGYTVRLERAGVYTQADIDAHPRYYNNGVDTLAIPVAEVERRAVRVVPSDDLRALKALGYRAPDTQSPTTETR